MNFKNKTVVVTGGAQGIGKAISKMFLTKGAWVSSWDIDQGALMECKNEWRSFQFFLPFQCDVSNPENIKNTLGLLRQERQSIDILINNAGILDNKPIEELKPEEWDRVLNVNLKSIYLMVHFCLPYILPGSVIINMASTRAFMSESNTEAYSASKGGVISLTHSLAISLAPKKVRVNSISPGWIETRDWKKESQREKPILTTIDHQQHPAGRVGVPEDIAHACLFLSSSEASFITGANLIVDGGMTIKMIYAD
ncbi:SDR family oxidoreductase [Atribacter laminatus]|jgi:NAD(P)-dependent dehydrogenase (short-subunit alcohol dehydrogenase family)|uniref:Dihydroanticapsin 7-dehydrogenase n=1 Tax=Atribacter laminatus TaxID=2847778 RepID=A0A7T1AKB4_ATRLM|nr:SDR family oxidoreductase [Atribacter laminatus]QPM67507.1 Dihydroanticapsin 7-dehydrogenase [Atribacter laminatus]